MTILMNRRIAALPHIGSFLADRPRAVAGWGAKPSGQLAGWLGALLGRPVLRLEDGFLRSITREEGPLSLLLDETGIYYDARAPSGMERAILRSATLADKDAQARAMRLAQTWRAAGLSKYNHLPPPAPVAGPYVLVADQCRGDLSLSHGLAGRGKAASRRFDAMLRAALDEHPDCTVLVKTHPESHRQGARGLRRPGAPGHPRLRVLAQPCHPARLIAGARAVYTLTSLIGFEALIWGRPLRCFAMPFYAGWGLSQDEMPPPPRRAQARGVHLADVLHAAFVDLPRYVDPRTGQRWSAQQAFADAAARLAALRHAELAAQHVPSLPARSAA